jgi:hypothetical protein
MKEFLQDSEDRDVLDAVARTRNMTSSVSNITARINPKSNGVHVSLDLTQATNIDKLEIRRAVGADFGTSIAIQSFSSPDVGTFEFDDISTDLYGNRINYWVVVTGGLAEDRDQYGPTACDFTSSDLIPPGALADFDVSHEAVVGGQVRVTVTVKPKDDSKYDTTRIYVSGYKGIAEQQSVAQESAHSFSFYLKQTGESVTFYAAPVNSNGVPAAAANWSSKVMVLDAGQRIPSKIMNTSCVDLQGGTQIGFETGNESGILDYKVYRGPRGGGFGAAALLATVAVTGAKRYTYLDAAVNGLYEWFVFARNAAGNGTASDAITPVIMFNSTTIPPNALTNSVSKATVDSIDNGVNATLRVYGAGGVGSAWDEVFGFGTRTFPYGTLTGSYSTTYYVMYDTIALTFSKSLTLPDTLPDNLVFAGKATTCAAGGGGGVSGGGGPGGDPDGCPEINTWLDDNLQAKNVIAGISEVRCDDGIKRVVRAKQIKPNVPCVRLKAHLLCARISKVVSWDTPVTLKDGTSVFARDMDGKDWLTDCGWLQCTVEEVGPRDVVKLDVGGATFAGSETRYEFGGFTHNMQKL